VLRAVGFGRNRRCSDSAHNLDPAFLEANMSDLDFVLRRDELGRLRVLDFKLLDFKLLLVED
jgi:hypothetical protein